MTSTDPPVLLVHGFASSAEHNWRQPGWLDLLADCGRETVAVDLPGHGTAPRPAAPAGYHNIEAHVAAAVEGREPLDAIGFSAGAHVLLRLAADQPDRFRRLALLGIGRGVLTPADPEPIITALTGDPDPENVPGMVFRRLADGLGNDRDALIAFLRLAAASADRSRPDPDNNPRPGRARRQRSGRPGRRPGGRAAGRAAGHAARCRSLRDPGRRPVHAGRARLPGLLRPAARSQLSRQAAPVPRRPARCRTGRRAAPAATRRPGRRPGPACPGRAASWPIPGSASPTGAAAGLAAAASR